MTLPLNRMTAEERERLCHAEGFTEAAKLFARIDELETVAAALLEALDDHYYEEKLPLSDAIEDAMGNLRGVLP